MAHPTMIAEAVESQIADLLAEGLSQRRVAKLTGVSRGTVGAIATGRRPVHLRRAKPAAEPPERVLGKCPTCGRMIALPCLACIACKAGEAPQVYPDRPEDARACDLALKPAHRARLDEVRQRRRLDAGEAARDAMAEKGRRVDLVDLTDSDPPRESADDGPLSDEDLDAFEQDPSPEPDSELWDGSGL